MASLWQYPTLTFEEVKQMARVIKLVSDITGTEAPEKDFVKCVVRTHPAVTEPKALDILPGELDGLKGVDNLVTLEVGTNGDKKEIVVSYADFKRLVTDDVVKNAPSTRGRRVGWSPNS